VTPQRHGKPGRKKEERVITDVFDGGGVRPLFPRRTRSYAMDDPGGGGESDIGRQNRGKKGVFSSPSGGGRGEVLLKSHRASRERGRGIICNALTS